MPGKSPNKSPWKNPKDLLKIRRKRLKITENGVSTQKSMPKPMAKLCAAASNPFKSSPVAFYGQTKRLKLNPPDFGDCMTEPAGNIFSALDDEEHSNFSSTPRRLPIDFSCMLRTEDKQTAVVNNTKLRTLASRPIDLSVATKLRITSTTPFPWGNADSSADVCLGQNWFVTNTPFDASKVLKDAHSQSAWLQRSSLLYSYPNLPWIHNFPRKQVRHGFLRASDMDAPSISSLGETIREAYRSKWSQTFQQLFQTLRTQQTPMFYVCCPSFTVLFLGETATSNGQIRAVLTPTTVGFRHALSADGVDFQILRTGREPIVQSKSDVPSPCASAFSMIEFPSTSETDDRMVTSDDEDNNENWLDRIKMSPRFSRKFRKFSKCATAVVSDSTESAVLTPTTEASVALYNFLLNSQLCWANTGSQAGMPPTLLSPCPFRGATLERLEIRQTSTKEGDSELYMLDLVGSVMPHNVFSTLSLLELTMPQFSVSLFGVQQYEVFNQLGQQESAQTDHSATDQVLNTADFAQFLYKSTGFQAIRDLQFTSGAYKVPIA